MHIICLTDLALLEILSRDSDTPGGQKCICSYAVGLNDGEFREPMLWHHILQATQAWAKFLWVILHNIAGSWWNTSEFVPEWLKGIYLLAPYFHCRFYVGKPAHMPAYHW